MRTLNRLNACRLATLIVSLGCLLAPTAWAEAPSGDYRRVFVPADEPELWPSAGEAMVPVDRDAMTRLLALLQSQREPSGAPLVERIDLHAHLDDGQLVGDGRAVIRRVELRDAFLPWPHQSMRIDSPRWEEDDGADLSDKALSSEALLGNWGQSEPPPFGLLVNRDGVLNFRFHSELVGAGEEESSYWIEAPIASTMSLILDLPEGIEPRIDSAVVTRTAQNAKLDPAIAPAEEELVRWLVKPAPSRRWRLRLVEDHPSTPSEASITSVSVNNVCLIDESGVQTRSRLLLESAETLPGVVLLTLPTDSHVVQASQDGLPIEWSIVEVPGERKTLRIPLRENRALLSTTLELSLLSPLEPGQPIALTEPTVLDCQWREGRTEVLLSKLLELQGVLRLLGAVVIQSGGAEDAPDEASRLVFQTFRPDAVIELRVGPPAKAMGGKVVRRCVISPSHAVTTLTIALPDDPSLRPRKLSWPLLSGWTVDSVEGAPAGFLEDWEVKKQGGSTGALLLRLSPFQDAPSTGKATLTLALSKPLSGVPTPWAIADLLAVELSGLREADDRLELASAAPYRLRLKNPPLLAPMAEGPPQDESVRFQLRDASNVLLLDGATVELAPDSSDQRIDCQAEVDLAPAGWVYRAEVALPLARDGLSQRVVRFVPPLPEAATISLGGSPPRPVSEFSIDPGDDAKTQSESLRLPLGNAQASTCVVRFEAYGARPLRVPLPTVEGAVRQRGVLVLRGIDGGRAGLSFRGLSPDTPSQPGSSSPLNDQTSSDQRFRYDPTRVGVRGPRVLLTRQGPAEQTAALSLSSLESHLLTDGRVHHRAELLVLSEAKRIDLEIPLGTRLLSVRDQSQAALDFESDVDSPRRLHLRLPQTTKSVVVSYADDRHDWKSEGAVSAALPIASPPSAWRWRVVAPEEDGLRKDSLNASAALLGWRERLFGPLAAPVGQPPLNPFSSESWGRAAERVANLSGLAAPASRAKDSAEGPLPAGWRAEEFLMVGAADATIPVYDRTQRIGGIAATGMLVMLLSAWLWPRAALLGKLLACLSVLAALLLPAYYAPWATAVWLGISVGALATVPIRAYRRRQSKAIQSEPARLSPAAALLLFLSLGLAFSSTAGGQEASTTPTPPLESILIPVDKSGQPVGDKWYLRDSFHKALISAEQQALHAAPADWALRSQVLSGALRNDPTTGEAVPDRWGLRVEGWTMRQNVPLQLPLRQTDADWEEKAMVDGIGTRLVWAEGGEGCEVVIAEPGPHQITIEMTPRVQSADVGSCVQLRLPRCAHSRLSLRVPPELIELRAQPAGGAARRLEDRKLFEVELGGQGEANVCWAQANSAGSIATLTCDLLQWVSMAPDGVTVAVQYQVEGPPPLPARLSIQLPLDLALEGAPAMTRQISLEPDTPWSAESDRLTFSAQLRMARRSGLGRVLIPAAPPQGAVLRSRLMAVSADPSVSVSLAASLDTSPLAPGEFLARWQGKQRGVAPRLAAAAADPLIDWRLEVDAQRVSPRLIDQRLRLLAGQQAIACRFQATLERRGWPVPWIAVRAPETFQPQSATLRIGDQVLQVRTTRPEPTRLMVFLPDELDPTGEFSLELLGVVSPTGSGSRPLPLLSVIDSTSEPLRVEVSRLADTLVQLENLPPDAAEAAPRESATPAEGLPVATFRVRSLVDQPRIKTRRNPAAFEAHTVSLHQDAPGGVEQGCLAILKVTSGSVSSVAVRTPSGDAAIRLVAPQNASLTPRPEQGAGHWRLEFPEPLTEGMSARLEFAVERTTTRRDAPAVLLGFPEATKSESLVALHEDSDSRGERWLTRGLQASRPSSRFGDARFTGAGWTTLRAR